MIFSILKNWFGGNMPEGLKPLPEESTRQLADVVANYGNPVEALSAALGIEFAEFSTSMEFGWLTPVFSTLETAGIPGHWSAVGNYLAGEFEKLRDGACKAWSLDADVTTFYIVLEREDFDTLSIWICSADKVVMEKLNAAADAQIEICEAESIGDGMINN
ncbi:MAG: hypothetical protein V8T90_05085 [Victivallales bacterium]